MSITNNLCTLSVIREGGHKAVSCWRRERGGRERGERGREREKREKERERNGHSCKEGQRHRERDGVRNIGTIVNDLSPGLKIE